jgi:hypothetical protein
MIPFSSRAALDLEIRAAVTDLTSIVSAIKSNNERVNKMTEYRSIAFSLADQEALENDEKDDELPRNPFDAWARRMVAGVGDEENRVSERRVFVIEREPHWASVATDVAPYLFRKGETNLWKNGFPENLPRPGVVYPFPVPDEKDIFAEGIVSTLERYSAFVRETLVRLNECSAPHVIPKENEAYQKMVKRELPVAVALCNAAYGTAPIEDQQELYDCMRSVVLADQFAPPIGIPVYNPRVDAADNQLLFYDDVLRSFFTMGPNSPIAAMAFLAVNVSRNDATTTDKNLSLMFHGASGQGKTRLAKMALKFLCARISR